MQKIHILLIVLSVALVLLGVVAMTGERVPILDNEGNVVGEAACYMGSCHECYYTRTPGSSLMAKHNCD